MSTKINDDCMSLEINGHVIATAECREHAAARREPPTGGLVGTAGPLSDRCIACQRGRAGHVIAGSS